MITIMNNNHEKYFIKILHTKTTHKTQTQNFSKIFMKKKTSIQIQISCKTRSQFNIPRNHIEL